jgi:GNAT superfamily N-acetyltransferase
VSLEAVEVAAWSSLYDAAPRPLAERLGLERGEVDGATRFRSRLPLVLFNRVLGMDAIRPSHLAALLPGMYLQVPDGMAVPDGLVERTRWVKLRRDPTPPAPAPAVEIREADAALAELFARTFCLGYELPAALEPWHAALVGRPGWRAYVAFDGATAIGTATMFIDGEVAWLGGAGTVPAHRGKGAQKALIARRIADAAAAGVRELVTETGVPAPGARNPSLDNLYAAGFGLAYERLNFVLP